MKIYLIGSLRNTRIPDIANALASDPQLGEHEVFADWFSPGPEADGFWKAYEERRGRNFLEAIKGPHAKHVFDYDKKWLDWAEVAVLALPAGRSAHLELGYDRPEEAERDPSRRYEPRALGYYVSLRGSYHPRYLRAV